jgi:DNA replication protein DnaC
MRKLIRADLLLLDDFALQGFDHLDTADIYELIVERHRAASTVVTSNRQPIEWLGQMSDALLAQSAIDRLQSAAYELVLEGESYRRHQKPGLDIGTTTPALGDAEGHDHATVFASDRPHQTPCVTIALR